MAKYDFNAVVAHEIEVRSKTLRMGNETVIDDAPRIEGDGFPCSVFGENEDICVAPPTEDKWRVFEPGFDKIGVIHE